MEYNELKEKFLEALQEELGEIDFSVIDLDKSMTEEYGINSYYIVQMIICAEDTFDIFFEDEELITKNYSTLNDMLSVIQKKLEDE